MLIHKIGYHGISVAFSVDNRIWQHISEHGPHLSATAMGKLFSTIKFVMKTPVLEVLKNSFV
jgi:hypothetical protein